MPVQPTYASGLCLASFVFDGFRVLDTRVRCTARPCGRYAEECEHGCKRGCDEYELTTPRSTKGP